MANDATMAFVSINVVVVEVFIKNARILVTNDLLMALITL